MNNDSVMSKICTIFSTGALESGDTPTLKSGFFPFVDFQKSANLDNIHCLTIEYKIAACRNPDVVESVSCYGFFTRFGIAWERQIERTWMHHRRNHHKKYQ